MGILIGLGGRVAFEDKRLHDKRKLVEEARKRKIPLQFTDLSRLDLTRMSLGGVDFLGSSFRHTTVRGSSFIGANLVDVDLNGCDVANAKFRGARLSSWSLVNARNVSLSFMKGAYLDGEPLAKTPLLFQMQWPVLITENVMRIGCEYHSHSSWLAFEPEDVKRMGVGALSFWRRYREPLLQWCAAQQRFCEGDYRSSRKLPSYLWTKSEIDSERT